MNINIEMNSNDIREAIRAWVSATSNIEIDPADVKILVKSKQNYKSEWEEADFKASFTAFRNT